MDLNEPGNILKKKLLIFPTKYRSVRSDSKYRSESLIL